MLASATMTPSAASMAHRPWMSSFSRKRSSEKTSLYGASACSLLTCAAPRGRHYSSHHVCMIMRCSATLVHDGTCSTMNAL